MTSKDTYILGINYRPLAGMDIGHHPAAVLLKKEAGVEKGSPTSNRTKVGRVTKAQVQKIAELKMPDLNATSLESAMKMVAGTARSMGLEVVD